MSAPSIRTTPRTGEIAPTRIRDRVDLPAPEGPTMARASPAAIWKDTPRRIGGAAGSRAKATFSQDTSPLGMGSGMASGRYAFSVVKGFRRATAARTETMLFQAPIPCSIGARARDKRIEAAMIAPGVTSCCRTSQAPRPRPRLWTASRTNLVSDDRSVERRRISVCNSSISPFRSAQRRASAERMPMASTTSALRLEASRSRRARMPTSPTWRIASRVAYSPMVVRTSSRTAEATARCPK